MVGCTDFSPKDYIDPESRRVVDCGVIRKDLETWLAEALMIPSRYELRLIGSELGDGRGASLVEMARLAHKKRRGLVGEGRAKAELRGVERMESVVGVMKAGEAFVLLSPPGSEKEGFGEEGGRRLSFSYIGIMGDDKKCLEMYAVPVREISPDEHINLLGDLLDRERTRMVIGGMDKESRSDRKLVSYPFLMTVGGEMAKTQAARRFGYGDYTSMSEVMDAEMQKRSELVTAAAEVIFEAVECGDGVALDVLGEVVREVFALESAGDLRGMSVMEVKDFFLVKAQAALLVRRVGDEQRLMMAGGVSGGYYLIMMEKAMREVRELRGMLGASYSAREILQGSSCGGGGWSQGRFGMERTVFNHTLLDLVNNYENEGNGLSGEKMCYKCPMCRGVKGDVYRIGRYLVCSRNPKEHRVEVKR